METLTRWLKTTKILVIAGLAILVLIVVLQNTESVETKLLFMSLTMPRAALLFGTLVDDECLRSGRIIVHPRLDGARVHEIDPSTGCESKLRHQIGPGRTRPGRTRPGRIVRPVTRSTRWSIASNMSHYAEAAK